MFTQNEFVLLSKGFAAQTIEMTLDRGKEALPDQEVQKRFAREYLVVIRMGLGLIFAANPLADRLIQAMDEEVESFDPQYPELLTERMNHYFDVLGKAKFPKTGPGGLLVEAMAEFVQLPSWLKKWCVETFSEAFVFVQQDLVAPYVRRIS